MILSGTRLDFIVVRTNLSCSFCGHRQLHDEWRRLLWSGQEAIRRTQGVSPKLFLGKQPLAICEVIVLSWFNQTVESSASFIKLDYFVECLIVGVAFAV